jgi:hypothetical protein
MRLASSREVVLSSGGAGRGAGYGYLSIMSFGTGGGGGQRTGMSTRGVSSDLILRFLSF